MADAFVQRLRELGWSEGRTVAIEYRWSEGRSERYAEIAAEFVRLKVDVILADGTQAAIAKQATAIIPIVFRRRETRSAPVWSLPGATGRQRHRPVEPGGRSRWQTPRNPARGCPRTSPVGDHGQCRLFRLRTEIREIEAAARTLGLEVVPSAIRRAEEIAPAFDAIKGRAEALYVVGDTFVNTQPAAHRHLCAGCATADDVRASGVRRSGRSDLLWAELSRT